MTDLSGKRVLVTGGTGSLGQVLVRRILDGGCGSADQVVVLSRDEMKQYEMRLAFEDLPAATDDVFYADRERRLQFRIGDVRDFSAIAATLRGIDVVFHAAALKQVPMCENAPTEAVQTNIGGAENIVRAIRDLGLPVETVVFVSTDKACKPVNVMGMTKAIQERILVQANLDASNTRFVGARYGNVLGSRGSVIPLFRHQIQSGQPLTITTTEMTRFFLDLDTAVDTLFEACVAAQPGEIYIPRAPSARIVDVIAALAGSRTVATKTVGMRPGEKVHEILVSEEEAPRTIVRGDYFVIRPALPELRSDRADPPFEGLEYSSRDGLLDAEAVAAMLQQHGLMVGDVSGSAS